MMPLLSILVQITGIIMGCVIWYQFGFLRGVSIPIFVALSHWLFSNVFLGMYVNYRIKDGEKRGEIYRDCGVFGSTTTDGLNSDVMKAATKLAVVYIAISIGFILFQSLR